MDAGAQPAPRGKVRDSSAFELVVFELGTNDEVVPMKLGEICV